MVQELHPQDSVPSLRDSRDYSRRDIQYPNDDPANLETRIHDKAPGVVKEGPPDAHPPPPTPARPISQDNSNLAVKEHDPNDSEVFPAFKRPPLSPESPDQSTSSVNPTPIPLEGRTSLHLQNPLERKGKEVERSLSNNDTFLGPSNPHSQGGRDSSTNDAIVSGDDEAEATKLSMVDTYSTNLIGPGKGQETVITADIPGELAPSPEASRRRTWKNGWGCLVQ